MRNLITSITVILLLAVPSLSNAATINVSFEPPAKREDGTAFAPSEVSAFHLRYSIDGGGPVMVELDQQARSHRIDNVPLTTGATVAVEVRAVDQYNQAGKWSQPYERTYSSPPGVPGNIEIDFNMTVTIDLSGSN